MLFDKDSRLGDSWVEQDGQHSLGLATTSAALHLESVTTTSKSTLVMGD